MSGWHRSGHLALLAILGALQTTSRDLDAVVAEISIALSTEPSIELSIELSIEIAGPSG